MKKEPKLLLLSDVSIQCAYATAKVEGVIDNEIILWIDGMIIGEFGKLQSS